MGRKKFEQIKGGCTPPETPRNEDRKRVLDELRRILLQAQEEKLATGKLSKFKYSQLVKSLHSGPVKGNSAGALSNTGDDIVRPGDFPFLPEVMDFLDSADAEDASWFPGIDQFIAVLGEQMNAEAKTVDMLISIQRGEPGHSAAFGPLLTKRIVDRARRALQKPIEEWKVTQGDSGEAIDIQKTVSEVKLLLDQVEAANQFDAGAAFLGMDGNQRKDLSATCDYIAAGLPIVDLPRHQMYVQYGEQKRLLYRKPTRAELRKALVKVNANFRSMDVSQFNRDCRSLGLVFTPVSAVTAIVKKYGELRRKLGRLPTVDEFRPFVRKSEVFRVVADWPNDNFIMFWRASGLKVTSGG